MKKLALLIVGCALLIIDSSLNKALAQQDPEYSMYMFNGLAVNPAYAGSRERPVITALYRQQWAGIKGAPKTFSLTGHAPLLNDRIGIGASVTSDNIGVLNMVNATADFAYRLPVGKNKWKGRLCFGLSASVDHFSNRLSESVLVDNSDPAFALNVKASSMNFGAGAYYYTDHIYVGASMPHLLNGSMVNNMQYESKVLAHQYRHIFITVGGMVTVSKNVKFKPSILLKEIPKYPVQLDVNASFLFKEALWLGASFRTTYNQPVAVIAMVEYMFAHQFRLGYAYDYTFTKIGQYQSGSHEIMISYEFGKVDKYLNPRKMSYF